MRRRAGNAKARCSAAYPTGREPMLRRENYCVTLTVVVRCDSVGPIEDQTI